MRSLLFVLIALTSTVSAQSDKAYAVYASQTDLANGSTLSDVLPTCLAVSGSRASFLTPPLVYFVDRTSGALAVYNPESDAGTRTLVVATAEMLEAAAGAPITGCVDADAAVVFRLDVAQRLVWLALDTPDGTVVLRLANNGAIDRLTDPASTIDAGRGVTGLTYGSVDFSGQLPVPVVFLARSRDAGAPESGVYTLDADTPDQSPVAFALDAAADPVGIAYSGFQRIDVVSSSGGTGDFRNVLLGVSGSTLVRAEQPCGTVPCAGALGAIATDYIADGDIFVPYSLVFDRGAPGTDDRILAVRGFGVPAEVVFTSSGLVSATGIAGFAVAGRNGYLAVVPSGTDPSRSTVLIASSDENGATPGIYGAAALLSVTSEASPATAATARLIVFPNPTVGPITVRVADAGGSQTVDVLDVLGRLVRSTVVPSSGEVTLDLSGLPSGVYAVRSGRAVVRVTVRR